MEKKLTETDVMVEELSSEESARIIGGLIVIPPLKNPIYSGKDPIILPVGTITN